MARQTTFKIFTMRNILLLVFYMIFSQNGHSQTIMQLLSAESYHAIKPGLEKEKVMRKLEKDGWFAIDTFVNLDNTMTFQKTDLAPYIDDFGSTVFLVTDVTPVFPGGKAALQKILRDSIGSIFSDSHDEVQKSIYIKFSVEGDGSITEVEEAQQHPEWVKPELIETCIQAVKAMPKWSPGIWKDKPVRVKMLLIVNLKE